MPVHCIVLLFALICVQSQINTFYRRDYYLDNSLYPEGLQDPNDGGRIHLIMPANKQNNQYPQYKAPFTVTFTTISVTVDPSTKLPDMIDWIHCDYQQSTGQIWVSLHIPTDDLLLQFKTFTIHDSTGAQMARFLNVQFYHTGLELYYVTCRILDENTHQIIMHWYCYYADTGFDVATLYFNGIKLDTKIPVGPQQHTVRVYNASTPINPGDIWTVHAILEDGLQMGWGGRFANPKQKYSIVASVINSQCPYPDINKANYDLLTSDLAINSMYLSSNTTCTSTPLDVLKYYNNNWSDINTVNYNLLTLEDSLSSTQNGLQYNNLSDFISALTVYNELKPVDMNATIINTSITVQKVWQQSLKRRLWYPSVMTALNSITNHECGTYSGVTDYLLAGFFMFGCRPTALTVNNYDGIFPVTATYDYLTNARMNNMPQAIWGAIQAFSNWEGGGYLTSSEVTLSIGQAIAAGVNALHVVATDVTQQSSDVAAWKSAQSLMASIQYLENQGLMRIASADGALYNGNISNSLWSALRTIDELIVIAVNLNCNGYDPSKCSDMNTEHWTCKDIIVSSVNMTVPLDWVSNNLKINVVEILNGKIQQVTFKIGLENSNTNLIFNDVNLSGDDTTRIFLLSKG